MPSCRCLSGPQAKTNDLMNRIFWRKSLSESVTHFMSSEHEPDWVERAQQGDAEAFRQLVRQHQQQVFHQCLGILKSRADAEDAVQTTFINAHRNLSKFERNAKFSTWLYRIARNASIDLLRKRKRREASDFDDFVDENRESAFDELHLSAPLGFDPRQELERKEYRVGIAKAFDALSPAHREILILREVENLSYQEISDTLEIKLGTVMSRLHHARVNAQKYLKENFPEFVQGLGAGK